MEEKPSTPVIPKETKPKVDLLAIERGWMDVESMLIKYGNIYKKRWKDGCQEPDYLTYCKARKFVQARGHVE